MLILIEETKIFNQKNPLEEDLFIRENLAEEVDDWKNISKWRITRKRTKVELEMMQKTSRDNCNKLNYLR